MRGPPMNSVDVPIHDRTWHGEDDDGGLASHTRAERLLPVLSGACLLVLDVVLVLAAFLLAYWVRFIAPDHEAAALGLEQYGRMGLTVGLGTVGLFALQGF